MEQPNAFVGSHKMDTPAECPGKPPRWMVSTTPKPPGEIGVMYPLYTGYIVAVHPLRENSYSGSKLRAEGNMDQPQRQPIDIRYVQVGICTRQKLQIKLALNPCEETTRSNNHLSMLLTIRKLHLSHCVYEVCQLVRFVG